MPEPLIAVREVAATGRSTARLDDATVTAARLAEEVGPLVEIHGQHDQGRLLDERWQRDLLDALRRARRRSATPWPPPSSAGARTAPRSTRLALDPREVARRLELLEHEADEIAAAQLRTGRGGRDPRPADGRPARRGHRPRSRDAPRRADRRGRRRPRRRRRSRCSEARGLARLDPRFEPLADRLAGLEAELEDVADEARGLAEGVDHDPRAARRARRAPRRSSTACCAATATTRRRSSRTASGRAAEAERLRGLDDERARRQADDAALLRRGRGRRGRGSRRRAGRRPQAWRRRRRRCSRSSASRRASSRSPSGAGWPAAGEAAVEIDGDALAFDATGIDQVVYRLAPNAGEPARPLARIASGGELSRVALAIKRVLAEADATPTLVFDEVDTGIGGRSADPIGRCLWALGPPPPGPVRHPPAADRRPRRRPLPDRQARARRADGHRGGAARPRGPHRRARRDARRAAGRRRRAGLRARAARPRRGLAGRAGRVGAGGLTARAGRDAPDLAAFDRAIADYLAYL